MPIEGVICYELVCPVCGIEHCKGDTIPYFNTLLEAENYVIGDLDWTDDEPMDRAIARACRIEGCGEGAWDKMNKKGEAVEKDKEKEESEVGKQKKLVIDKKAAQAYLKARVEHLDLTMAQHFAKGNYMLAGHDAKKMGELLYLLGEIDISG